MKRKANPAEAVPLPTCTAVGPEDMVLVACTSGETFLVERNCAIVSGHCRDLLQVWEGAVRRIALQSRDEESTISDGAATEITVVPCMEADSHSRDAVGPLATDPTVITFMPFMDADDASPLEALCHVPVTLVAEHYQKRLRAAEAISPSKADRPSSKQVPSYGDRKGASVIVAKPISPLAPMESADGTPMYPVVVIPYMTPELMEAALSYAHRKYRIDMDGEKSGAEPAAPISVASAEGRWRLIAASVLTGV
ncbi:conserved hypothetical protein [Leishmania major strain Friedlin]|uniref:Uncharacterized protein n=1 Tax=Leishmania major TaxID=5664 RepID=Q4Q8P1_LEIMA|nr:conserved hypothetical protein [Leishmania major strain Friedlin]CAG9577072.1 hypothetical_protein_-_conserved [Leishmania major strain Friedlin]CAJ04819.1 conserved hypothetical protein [Leishmania major strain Friedlin]|eukprot:XP_001684307.1 conserved hypothetical protein [Leishmania major strain Friedlin]